MTHAEEVEMAYETQALLRDAVVQLKRIADALENTYFTDRICDSVYNAITQAARGLRR